MFTGIIEEMGTVRRLQRTTRSCQLTIAATIVLQDTKIGDSIAVNGVCLTVTDLQTDAFTADVMPETLRRSSLGILHSGSLVNLERAMAANGRFGGHIVSGHIDGTGTVLKIQENEIAVIFTIGASRELLDGIVPKGSVALDGISLTVVEVTYTAFSISLIPHTRTVTNMREKGVGDPINIETDVIGKYVKKYITEPAERASDTITMDFLAEKGFM